jgi:hypothetical protein
MRQRRRLFFSACAILLVTGSALVAAGAAGAAAAPTSVSLFGVDDGGRNVPGLIAVQRLGGNSVRLTGLIRGLPAGKTDLALVRTADCAQPIGHELLRVHIPTSGAFDVRGKTTAPFAATNTRLGLYFDDYERFVCLRIPKFASKGSVVLLRPHGRASETATGVATFQRRPAALGVIVFPRAAKRSVSLVQNLRSCTAPATTREPLQLSRREQFFYGDIFKSEFATYRTATSWVFGGSGGCVKWPRSELNALTS